MSDDSVTVVGMRTGVVMTQESVLNSVAFDLSGVDLRGRAIVSATLHLELVRPMSTVFVTDPSAQAEYGLATCPPREHAAQIYLSAEAVRDLYGASGSFFSMNTVVCDDEGVPQRLSSIGTEVLTISLARANNIGTLDSDSRAAA